MCSTKKLHCTKLYHKIMYCNTMKCPMTTCCTISLLCLFTTYSETKCSEYLSKPWLLTPKIHQISHHLSDNVHILLCWLTWLLLKIFKQFHNLCAALLFALLCLNHLFIIFSSLCLTNLRQESHQITQKKRENLFNYAFVPNYSLNCIKSAKR